MSPLVWTRVQFSARFPSIPLDALLKERRIASMGYVDAELLSSVLLLPDDIVIEAVSSSKTQLLVLPADSLPILPLACFDFTSP